MAKTSMINREAKREQLAKRYAAKRAKLKEAVQRILADPITRPIGMDEIIAEMKQEHEERADRWRQ